MKPHKITPPALAQKILLRFLSDDLAEEVLGDLEEKFYHTLQEKSLFRARLNYWLQVLHYLRPFAIRKLRTTHLNHYAMYRSYFKIGWRNLLRNKGYSAINIGGLAMGMVVALLIGLWINDELSFNKYHKNYNSIAKVYRLNDWGEGIQASTPMMVAFGGLLRSEYDTHFKNVVMIRQRIEDRVLSYGDKKLTQGGYFMQSEGVEMFSLKLLHGSKTGTLNDMKSIIISESLAKKLFGTEDAINKSIRMNAANDFMVTGVFEDLPKNSELYGASFFAPLNFFVGGEENLNVWDNYNMTVYVQLNDETKLERIGQIASVFTTLAIFISCLGLFGLASFVAEQRTKEIGIRKILGASVVNLWEMLSKDFIVLVVIACGISVPVAFYFMNGWLQSYDYRTEISGWVFLVASIGALMITIITVSFQAIKAAMTNPVKSLRSE